ncbi:MAG TPA: energy transducer TonB [Flavobacteriales bacterium]|nr:energy transducer TonB [Flavobacteriales bacterium]
MKNIFFVFILLFASPAFSQDKTKTPEVVPDQQHVEEKAQFPGGPDALAKFLSSELKYPTKAYEKKVEGKVYVEFVIDETGKVKGVRVKRKGDPDLDAEAIRVVKAMPNWTPAKVIGKPVKSMTVLPVNFVLPPKMKEDKK